MVHCCQINSGDGQPRCAAGRRKNTESSGLSGKVHLSGTIRIPLGRQPALLPLLEGHIAASLAEPGCERFEITRDADDAELFRLDELFRDEAAFAQHQERTRASDWGRASADCPRDFRRSAA